MKLYLDNIERSTLSNDYYRKVIYTGNDLQLVLMNLTPGEYIPEEIHPDTEQFIRIESGKGSLIINNKEYSLYSGDAFIIPKNTRHSVINNSSKDLKIYSLYSKQEHPKTRKQFNQPK